MSPCRSALARVSCQPRPRSAQARTSQVRTHPLSPHSFATRASCAAPSIWPGEVVVFRFDASTARLYAALPARPTSSQAMPHRVAILGSFPPSAMALRSGSTLTVGSSHPTTSIPSGRTVRLTSHTSLPCTPKPSCYRCPCTADAAVPSRSAAAPLWLHAASHLYHPPGFSERYGRVQGKSGMLTL
jgi:hypothetical protein